MAEGDNGEEAEVAKEQEPDYLDAVIEWLDVRACVRVGLRVVPPVPLIFFGFGFGTAARRRPK